MRTAKLASIAALVMATAPATALMPGDFKIQSTRELIKLCGAREEDPLYHGAKAFCLGYLDAVWD